ncbi:MAG TPA: PAS domain-containing protein [Candidatus Acidoferrum sp.]|nr:PAS domain-containing protein [Candidatus Acidoferrum sp.]
MGLHTSTPLNRRIKRVGERTVYAGRFNIGPRLILGFVFIILSMLAADAVLLWQFQLVRTQAARLNGVDQKLIAVQRIYASLLVFHDRLEELADSQDLSRLVEEGGPLRTAVLEDTRRAMNALSLPPFEPQRDPTILPTLHVIQSALPSQLETITTLAKSGDWRAVHLRLANEVTQLESLTSAIVENVDREVSEEQAQTVRNIRRVQRLVFVMVPLTALVTLLIAATLGVAITRSITRPLARLVEGSKALARGEFQHQVTVTGNDELAHVGRVFNDTARRLQDLYATLQRSEDRLRLVIDTIPAHAWSARPDGSVDFINRRFLEFTGRSMGDMLGWGWGSLVHPDDLTGYVGEWQAAVATGEPMEGEVRVRRVDGEYRWLLIRNVPLRDELGNIVNWYGTAIDIEERHRAEDALRRSEVYLSEAQRLSHTGSFGWCVSTGEINWSEETFRIFQYDRTIKPTIELIVQRVHPEDVSSFKETTARALRDGKDFEHEYRLVMPGGAVKHVHVVARAEREESGEIEFVGAVMDVTDRKRAEKALRQSESYLAEAQMLSRTGSWATNPEPGEIRYWSEECYRVLGYDPDEELPRLQEFIRRIHPDDQARIVRQIESATRENAGFEFDYRIVHPNGEVRDIHTIGHPVFGPSGDLVEYVGTVMDITERKLAEALREGESRILEMIARDAPLEETLEKLVLVVEGQFADLVCSVLLLDEDGQHVRHGAAPSLPEAYTKAIDGLCIGPKAGSCGTAMYRRELVVVTDILKDPLWEPYRDVAAPYGFRACWSIPILAHSGKALGSFAMYYPEPRGPSRAETRALELANHLAGIAIERKLAREERERLRQAQMELAHVNRVTTMGELTASLAHEVNQPIAAAVISANTCVRWLAGEVPNLDKARAAAMRIAHDATRAAEIIRRIRLLFQKGSLQLELVDVNEVIEEMIVLLRGEATRYLISFRTELAADLPPVMGDRVQLQQVMMNLMINSIDAMRAVDGARELAIKSQSAENERILLSVSDTGVGLPTQADEIFNAFFTTKPHGTGMGLRICRSIIESHGGRLWAANNSPRGAILSVTLPAELERHK